MQVRTRLVAPVGLCLMLAFLQTQSYDLFAQQNCSSTNAQTVGCQVGSCHDFVTLMSPVGRGSYRFRQSFLTCCGDQYPTQAPILCTNSASIDLDRLREANIGPVLIAECGTGDYVPLASTHRVVFNPAMVQLAPLWKKEKR